MKTKEQILKKCTGSPDWEASNHELTAMEIYAKQEAIAFASFICNNRYSPHPWMDSTFIDHNNNGEYEAVDLYEDFQQSKSINV